jgi:invasin D
VFITGVFHASEVRKTAIDSQKNSVNSSVSQLLERFRQDNSTFETMIQLLTKMTEDLHRYNAGYLQ